jgi:hypothetical protein
MTELSQAGLLAQPQVLSSEAFGGVQVAAAKITGLVLFLLLIPEHDVTTPDAYGMLAYIS